MGREDKILGRKNQSTWSPSQLFADTFQSSPKFPILELEGWTRLTGKESNDGLGTVKKSVK